MIHCTLRGGPLNGRTIDIPLPMCHERIAVEGDHWFGDQGHNGVAIVRGPRSSSSPWVAFVRHVYEKVGTAHDGHGEYRFVDTVEVHRCEARTKAGTRCRNEIQPGIALCRTHAKAVHPKARAKSASASAD